MKEVIIEFETAKLAKEKGFRASSTAYYTGKSMFKSEIGVKHYCQVGSPQYKQLKTNRDHKGKPITDISAPTQSLLQKWLREKHKIDVLVTNTYDESGTYAASVHKNTHRNIIDGFTMFYKYEQALEEGLLEALKLIKIENK